MRSLRGRRAAFGVLAAAALTALAASGDAVYLWILFFQGVLLAAGWLQVRLTLGAVRVRIELPEGRIESGGSVRIPMKVSVDSFMPPAHLALEFLTADARRERATVYASLAPGKPYDCVLECDCPYRGEYEIGAAALEGVDLFGLIRIRIEGKKLKTALSSVVVYPKTYELEQRLLDLRMNEGAEDGAKRDAGEVSSIADLREWRDGDSLKRVHWKLSARMRKTIVKEFDGSFDAKNLVFVDGTRAGFPARGEQDDPLAAEIRRLDTEETIAAAAASFCRLFCENGRRVKLVSCAETRSETESHVYGGMSGGYEALCLHLAQLRFGGGLDATKVLGLECERFGAPDSVVFITCDVSAALVEALAALGERGSRITLVCCGEEPGAAALAELRSRGVAVERARMVEGGARA